MSDPVTAFGLFVLSLFRRRPAAPPREPSIDEQMAELRAELERALGKDFGNG